MKIKQFKNTLIPEINAFCDHPVIEADQKGKKPKGPHATFKITSPYIPDGQGEQRAIQGQDTFKLIHVESYKMVLSFTAYDTDADASHELAQEIHDWFKFYGLDFLDNRNIVVVELSTVQNRDLLLVDDYERRNGFDVTLRLTRELAQDFDYIEETDIFDPMPDIEFDGGIEVDFEFDNDGVIDCEYIGEIEATLQVITTDQPLAMSGSIKAGEQVIL